MESEIPAAQKADVGRKIRAFANILSGSVLMPIAPATSGGPR
jgi:hypothetical protein